MQKGLTQRIISSTLGFARDSAYQKYESGLVIPPPDKLSKLAELYGVTTDYLLGREGGTVAEESNGYADNLDAMGCKLAYHEIMRAVATKPRKLSEFRKLLENFREES